jgi:adhesin transport system outer membrane protein
MDNSETYRHYHGVIGRPRYIQTATYAFSVALVSGGFGLLSMPALAQSLPSGMSLPGSSSLQDVVQRTIVQNPQVKIAFRAFKAADYDRDEAWGGYLPTVDASVGVAKEDNAGDGQGSFSSDFAQLELNQMVYDGFATASDVERLEQASLVRYYELLDASNQVAAEAVRAYADVLRHRELVRLAQDNYAEHLRVYNQIEERALSGAGRGVDLEQVSGRLALAEANLMTEASNLHDVSARYKRIVGTLPAENLEPPPSFNRELPASVAEAVQLAFEGNPEFHAAFKNIEAIQAQKALARASFHPRVDIVGRTGTNNNDAALGTRRDEHSIELVASMNLFNGGSDLASFRAESERIEEAIGERELLCHNIRQTTQITYNDTQRIREQMQYLNQHRQSIDRVRGVYQQQFEIGMRTLLDVLDSENEFFEASRSYVNAQYDLIIAEAQTLSSMGQLMRTLEVANADIPSLAELGHQGVEISPEVICPTEGPAGFTLDDLVGGMQMASAPTRQPDVTLSADTLFAVNSAVLSPDARGVLISLASDIRGRSDLVRVYITGHADSTGSDAINEPLSRNRAESVAQFLIGQGVDASLIQIEGFGARDPVASNSSQAGRRQNRRVEITLQTRAEMGGWQQVQENSAAPMTASILSNTAVERQVSQNPRYQAAEATPLQEATPLREATPLQATSPANIGPDSSVDRYIQVVALSTKASALELQQNIDRQLDAPTRLVNGGGFYRVQVGANAQSVGALRQQLSTMGFADTFMVRS